MSKIGPRADALTPREVQVLKLIATGLSSKEIASTLGIRFKTVVCHRTRVLQKLDLHGTAELTRYAVHHSLVPGDLTEETRLRQVLRTSHREYMEALSKYNDFLNERRSLGLENPDSSTRTRQLWSEEQRRHHAYRGALEIWTEFVLGKRIEKKPASDRPTEAAPGGALTSRQSHDSNRAVAD